MRSFGRLPAAALLLFVLADGRDGMVYAQAAATPPADSTEQNPVQTRYEALLGQEERVVASPASVSDDYRVVINRYWIFVRRYPKSGFADNALWQAGNLSMNAFARFSEERDRYRAIQLLQWLRDQYPHSSFVAKVPSHIDRLAADAGTAAIETKPVETKPDVPSTNAGADTVIRAVHREVLPDVVRITIELDREVPFYQERIDGPSRLFFDLKGTRTVPSLVDATFRYDSGVVRHIRLGRHPGNTTRIVLDLEHVDRYSVFTLYNPYRIVIDSEPVKALQLATRDPETPGTERILPGAPRVAVAPNPSVPKPTPPAAKSKVPAVKPPTIASTAAPAGATADEPNLHGESATPIAPGRPIAPATNSGGKFSVARQLGLGISRVVIDAGHGGHDPGASAFGISEAELVLDVALRLEKLLRQQPGMEVVLTRRSNDYVALDERTEIANRESADLFLSIHANASANAAARGVETYFLNFALNRQAEAVAARENAASGKTMSSLPDIIKAITLNSKVNESRDFASGVQRALVQGLRPGNKALRDLGVKQAPFMVLIGAAMPSVLAEISFVTNRDEARLLKSNAYRQRIAESLLAGVLRYQQSLKKVQTAALQ